MTSIYDRAETLTDLQDRRRETEARIEALQREIEDHDSHGGDLVADGASQAELDSHEQHLQVLRGRLAKLQDGLPKIDQRIEEAKEREARAEQVAAEAAKAAETVLERREALCDLIDRAATQAAELFEAGAAAERRATDLLREAARLRGESRYEVANTRLDVQPEREMPSCAAALAAYGGSAAAQRHLNPILPGALVEVGEDGQIRHQEREPQGGNSLSGRLD